MKTLIWTLPLLLLLACATRAPQSVQTVSESTSQPAPLQETEVIHVRDIVSSGYLPKDTKNDYLPFNLFDGRTDTMWAENSPLVGIGEFVRIDFENAVTIDQLTINNGYDDPAYFAKNNRVCILEVDFDGKVGGFFQLQDTATTQVLKLPDWQKVKSVTFVIRAVYPGSRWNDTCISEVGFYFEGHKLSLLTSGTTRSEQVKQSSESIERCYGTDGVLYQSISTYRSNERTTKEETKYIARDYVDIYRYKAGRLIGKSEEEFIKSPGNERNFNYEYRDGRIYRIMETRNSEDTPNIPYVHKYNYAGALLQSITTTKAGVVVSSESNTYTAAGALQEKKIAYETGMTENHQYFYDGNRLVRETITVPDMNRKTITYEYVNGRLVWKRGINNHGNEGKIHFLYDAEGRKKFEISYGVRGKIQGTVAFEYNPDGTLFREAGYSSWSYDESKIFHYDSSFQITSYDEYFGSNFEQKIIYDYEEGRLKSTRANSGEVISYQYNKLGQLVGKKSSYGEYGESWHYSYVGGRIAESVLTEKGEYSRHVYEYSTAGELNRVLIYDRTEQYLGTCVFEYLDGAQ